MSSRLAERLTRSFGSRLALWYFALFVTSVALILVITYALLAASLRTRDREVIESTLARYAAAFERAGLAGLNQAIAADRQSGGYQPLLVRVTAPGRGTVSFFSMPGSWNAFDLDQLEVRPLSPERTWIEISAPGRDERLEVATAQLRGGELVQVGKSTAGRDDLLQQFRSIAVILFAVVVVAAVAGGAALTSSALRPLRSMTAAVRSILETGSVQARVAVAGTGDPLDAAAALMNRMLERIEVLIRDLRGSLDNVAHDLRTPLTRLRATAERALQTAGSADDYRTALAACVDEADRLVTLLDGLMDLSEAHTGTLRVDAAPADLVPIVRSAVELYDDFAEAKGVRLTASLPEALPVVVDATRIRQAVANLLDNAVKYTPAGGSVTIAAAREDATVVVEVVDTGPGIAPADLPRIWERLYRGDRSRSQRGLGLGLSLVKAIVEAHGGRAEVESSLGAGARFRILLPT